MKMKCFAFCCTNWRCKMKMNKLFDCRTPSQDQCVSPRRQEQEALTDTLLAASDSKSLLKHEEISTTVCPTNLNFRSHDHWVKSGKQHIYDHNKEEVVDAAVHINPDSDDEMLNNHKLRENENDEEVEKKNVEGEKSNDSSNSTSLVKIPIPAAHNEEDLLLATMKSSKEQSCSDLVMKEYSSESSLFSLSINSRKQLSSAVEMGDAEVTSCPFKLVNTTTTTTDDNPEASTGDISLILFKKSEIIRRNPSPENEGKENKGVKLVVIDDEVSKSSSLGNVETAADATSLSSWLQAAESQKSPQKSSSSTRHNSPESEKNYVVERRRILGEITHHDQNQLKRRGSKSLSPRSATPSSCSGDDHQPSIGTVGNYWRHMGSVTLNLADSSSS